MSGALCNLMTTGPRLIRRRCPFCDRREVAIRFEHYDTVRLVWRCGTAYDAGYGDLRFPRGRMRECAVAEEAWRRLRERWIP